MKKIAFILAAFACSLSVSAQRLQLTQQHKTITDKLPLSTLGHGSPRQLTPVSYSPITRRPDGDQLTDVVWSSSAAAPNSSSQVEWTQLEGFVPTIVVNGDKMYIQSPLTQFTDYCTNWIVGTISGETVTFKTPQCYYVDLSSGLIAYVTRLSSTGQVDEDNTDITFIYKDGNLTQIDGGVLALTNETGGFYGYAETNIKVTKLNDVAATLPEGAELQTYKLTASGKQQTAQVAFVGQDVYISDPVGVEDAWMKGTREGNTISIPTKQYLGSGSGFPLYVLSAKKYTYKETNAMGQIETKIGYQILSDEAITFTCNEADGSFATDQILFINSAKDQLGQAYVAYEKPSYEPWTQVAATPANPHIDSYIDLTPYSYLGYKGSLFGFTVPDTSDKGEFIAQESIYYQFSFDGTPLELYGTTYIPYYGSVADADQGLYLSLSGSTHTLQHPDVPKQSVGIQSFYVVGADVYESQQFTYNIVNGELQLVDAITDVIADVATKSTMYNLAGQRVGKNAKGIVIVNGKKILKK